MPWFIQLIMAIFMGMYTSSSYSDKRIFYSFGIGTYSIHHTIIYWRIIKLFK